MAYAHPVVTSLPSGSQCIQADCPVSYLKTLIVAGARINEADRQGQTPLHIAAERGHSDIVKLLLDNNADLEAVEKVYIYCVVMYSASFTSNHA